MRKTFSQNNKKTKNYTRIVACSTSQEGLLAIVSDSASHSTSQGQLHKRATQNESTQVDEYLLAHASLQKGGKQFPLQMLPSHIMIQIMGMLDVVSLVCLKLTSRRLHRVVHVQKRELSACAMWMITCRLEKDLLATKAPLPKRLACAFCKRSHLKKSFKLPHTVVGDGMICTRMTDCPIPKIRYCWRHFPKRICYSPSFRDREEEEWARSLVQER